MPGFRSRGVMARIGFLMPESLLGNRTLCGPEIPAKTALAYKSFIVELLDIPISGEPQKIKLSKAAYNEWHDFALVVESQMKPGGRFEVIKDWAGKLPGFAIRLSGLTHIMDGGGPEITLPTMEKALSLASIFVDHALFTFGMIEEDGSINAARKILSWIERTGSKEFSKRDCFAALQGSFTKMEKIEPGFSALEEHNYIAVSEKKTGGRPSSVCYVNPTFRGGAS